MTHPRIEATAGALLVSVALTGVATAQGGPAATACKDDIPKLGAGKEHGQGDVRAFHEAKEG